VVLVDWGEAMLTVAKERPPAPTVEVGESVNEVGGGCDVSVTCEVALAPFQVAVTATVVAAETALVVTGNETEKSPGSTVTVAGGLTTGELVDKLTRAPPAGAWPFSITIPVAVAPPLIVLGEMDSEPSAGGSTVSWMEAVPPLSVAEIVTGVGDVTCPACNVNCVHALLPGIVSVAGTGTTLGLELVNAMVAPAAGTAAVSCTATQAPSPLYIEFVAEVSDTGVGGAELMLNVPVDDQSVTAAVVGDESPWCERTRQNFVPGKSDSTVRDAPVSCGANSSMVAKPGSAAICSS
jgi:hypothetical protein